MDTEVLAIFDEVHVMAMDVVVSSDGVSLPGNSNHLTSHLLGLKDIIQSSSHFWSMSRSSCRAMVSVAERILR